MDFSMLFAVEMHVFYLIFCVCGGWVLGGRAAEKVFYH